MSQAVEVVNPVIRLTSADAPNPTQGVVLRSSRTVRVTNPHAVVATASPGYVRGVVLKEGPPGPPGPVTVEVGATSTGAPGTEAAVTNRGSSENLLLDFTVPRGDKGPPGPDGDEGPPGPAATVVVGTVTTGDPGTEVQVVNSGTTSAAVLDFTIPEGEAGTVAALAAIPDVAATAPEDGDALTYDAASGLWGPNAATMPFAHRYRTANYTTTSNPTPVVLDGNVETTGITWDGANNQFVIQKAGIYAVALNTNTNNNNEVRSYATAQINHNGSRVAATRYPGGAYLSAASTLTLRLNLGDTLDFAIGTPGNLGVEFRGGVDETFVTVAYLGA